MFLVSKNEKFEFFIFFAKVTTLLVIKINVVIKNKTYQQTKVFP